MVDRPEQTLENQAVSDLRSEYAEKLPEWSDLLCMPEAKILSLAADTTSHFSRQLMLNSIIPTVNGSVDLGISRENGKLCVAERIPGSWGHIHDDQFLLSRLTSDRRTSTPWSRSILPILIDPDVAKNSTTTISPKQARKILTEEFYPTWIAHQVMRIERPISRSKEPGMDIAGEQILQGGHVWEAELQVKIINADTPILCPEVYGNHKLKYKFESTLAAIQPKHGNLSRLLLVQGDVELGRLFDLAEKFEMAVGNSVGVLSLTRGMKELSGIHQIPIDKEGLFDVGIRVDMHKYFKMNAASNLRQWMYGAIKFQPGVSIDEGVSYFEDAYPNGNRLLALALNDGSFNMMCEFDKQIPPWRRVFQRRERKNRIPTE